MFNGSGFLCWSITTINSRYDQIDPQYSIIVLEIIPRCFGWQRLENSDSYTVYLKLGVPDHYLYHFIRKSRYLICRVFMRKIVENLNMFLDMWGFLLEFWTRRGFTNLKRCVWIYDFSRDIELVSIFWKQNWTMVWRQSTEIRQKTKISWFLISVLRAYAL